MNEETQKQEQPGLQGSHPSEALSSRMADEGLSLADLAELGAADLDAAADADEWDLGPAYCGTDGICESCQ